MEQPITCVEYEVRISELEDTIKTNWKEAKLKEPLVKVGGHIRARFLEHSKAAVWKKYKPDMFIIERGNRAAHCGDWEADRALLIDQFTEQNERLKAKTLKLKDMLTIEEKQIAKLEEDRDIKEPLSQVGVHVRLASLEKAKEAMIRHYRADRTAIEKRNAAVHEGNWKAEISPFYLKLVSCRSWSYSTGFIPGKKVSYEVWVKAYGILPADCPSSLSVEPKRIEHMNLGFTVFAAKLRDSPALWARQDVAAAVPAWDIDNFPERDGWMMAMMNTLWMEDVIEADSPGEVDDKINANFSESPVELDENGFEIFVHDPPSSSILQNPTILLS
ncbi:hypothetical protein IFR05_016594 [Cadophora sp. M221]|nr:hypothetical protein IFR05_016594 [Cadophora sp. M221]